jgi:hypothetical protein
MHHPFRYYILQTRDAIHERELEEQRAVEAEEIKNNVPEKDRRSKKKIDTNYIELQSLFATLQETLHKSIDAVKFALSFRQVCGG